MTVPPPRTLEEFLDWWIQTRPFKPPMERPINVDGSLYGVVLYRDGPFQVQLFIVAPGSEVPDHVHPNVDSYEIYFSGHVAFRKHGEYVTTPKYWGVARDIGVPALFGHVVEVLSTDPHGGQIGPAGGCFLSVQKWLNGVPPTSVGDDWAYAGAEQRAKSFVKDQDIGMNPEGAQRATRERNDAALAVLRDLG